LYCPKNGLVPWDLLDHNKKNEKNIKKERGKGKNERKKNKNKKKHPGIWEF